jgi:DNA-binding PadR family transcriptional regulator
MALSHAILSVLIDCPCSGYDLAKQFDQSVGFFWSASHQQIYRELTKLEEQGYLQGEVIPQAGRPDKKCYHVTDHGHAFLQNWMAEPSDIPAIKDDLLVKLYAGAWVTPALLIQELHHHHRLHQERLATYLNIAQTWFALPETLERSARYRYLTLQCGIRYETQWLDWFADVLRTLEAEG